MNRAPSRRAATGAGAAVGARARPDTRSASALVLWLAVLVIAAWSHGLGLRSCHANRNAVGLCAAPMARSLSPGPAPLRHERSRRSIGNAVGPCAAPAARSPSLGRAHGRLACLGGSVLEREVPFGSARVLRRYEHSAAYYVSHTYRDIHVSQNGPVSLRSRTGLLRRFHRIKPSNDEGFMAFGQRGRPKPAPE